MQQGKGTEEPCEKNSGQCWGLDGEINKDRNNQSLHAEVKGENPYE